jgi:hypothetical protein
VALIRQARGLSSVAHPRFITTDRVRLRQVILDLKACGLDGVEAYHSDHGAEDRLYFIRLANQLGMMITGGSDYHGFKTQNGPPDNGGKLGSLQLPYGFAVRLRRAYFNAYPIMLLLLEWPSGGAAAMCRAFEAHYQLSSVRWPHWTNATAMPGSTGPARGSLVVDLPASQDRQVGSIIAASRDRGMRVVGVPWETAGLEAMDGCYQTRRMSAERFRQTSVERLAHQLIHEVILAQLG